MDVSSLGFGGGFGVGAILGSLVTKIIIQIWRNKTSKEVQRKKSVADACDKAWQLNSLLCTEAVKFYCLEFNRDNAVKLKVQMGELSTCLIELNKDLEFILKSELIIPNKMIIDLRQAVTLRVFERRTENYQFTDAFISDLYKFSDSIGSCIRLASRSLK